MSKQDHPSVMAEKEANRDGFPIKVVYGGMKTVYYRSAGAARTAIDKGLVDLADMFARLAQETPPGIVHAMEQAVGITGEPFGTLNIDVLADPDSGVRFRAIVTDRRPIAADPFNPFKGFT